VSSWPFEDLIRPASFLHSGDALRRRSGRSGPARPPVPDGQL